MDRLSAVIALCAACACGSSGDRAGSSRERVNAVKAAPTDQVDPAAMCDVFHPAGSGPRFAWPALTGPAPELSGDRWQWVNVWATWCKPCIEELPRLVAWQRELGDRVALHFLSADASDEDVAAYRANHPDTPASVRMADPDAAPAWLGSLGAAGSLPVHVFIARGGEVRCVRASAVEDTDFAAIDALLR